MGLSEKLQLARAIIALADIVMEKARKAPRDDALALLVKLGDDLMDFTRDTLTVGDALRSDETAKLFEEIEHRKAAVHRQWSNLSKSMS